MHLECWLLERCWLEDTLHLVGHGCSTPCDVIAPQHMCLLYVFLNIPSSCFLHNCRSCRHCCHLHVFPCHPQYWQIRLLSCQPRRPSMLSRHRFPLRFPILCLSPPPFWRKLFPVLTRRRNNASFSCFFKDLLRVGLFGIFVWDLLHAGRFCWLSTLSSAAAFARAVAAFLVLFARAEGVFGYRCCLYGRDNLSCCEAMSEYLAKSDVLVSP